MITAINEKLKRGARIVSFSQSQAIGVPPPGLITVLQ